MEHDVAIVGGGPGGSTVGTLLKKYAPQMRIVILEQALEAMLLDGWVVGRIEKGKGTIGLRNQGGTLRSTAEGMEALKKRDEAARRG